MVIYTDEKDLQWHKLLDKGLEVALLAHANSGETHGESIGLSRAFDLAHQFGAIPIDRRLSYELMMNYPEQFDAMMNIAGSNHTWLSTTLCVYAGDERINVEENVTRNLQQSFGYIEESSGRMNNLILKSNNEEFEVLKLYKKASWFPDKVYQVMEDFLWKFETKMDILNIDYKFPYIPIPQLPSKLGRRFEPLEGKNKKSFLYVDVPPEQRNRLHIVEYPNYSLKKNDLMVEVQIDWEKTEVIPNSELEFNKRYYHIKNSRLLPNFLKDGFEETKTYFYNPTLGFFAPAESYGPYGREKAKTNKPNYWAISTRGEAVIIQRPI
jgi:hypothetical protein